MQPGSTSDRGAAAERQQGSSIAIPSGWQLLLQRYAGPVVLALLTGFLCLYGLGANGVHEQDEAWHAQAVMEFYRRCDWWRLTQFGRPYFEKPTPLLWLVGVSYRVLGPTLFAARLWPALFAIGAVLATYALGTRIAGRRVGFVAGLALATSYMFVYRHCGRTVQFDSLLVLSFVLSTVLFLRAAATNRGWLACAAATALASYAKNFAAAAPALVFVVTLLIARPAHRPTLRQWLRLGIFFAALHLVWLVPMAIVHGKPFLANFLGHQVLGRPGLGRSQSTAFIASVYFQNLGAGFFPWFFLGIAALPDALYRARRRDTGRVVLLVWVAVLIVLLGTVLRQALIWYVIPLFPFLAVLGALFLVDGEHRPLWLQRWQCVSMIALIGLVLVSHLQPEPYPFALWSQDRRLVLAWNDRTQAAILAALLALALWRYHRRSELPQRLCLVVLTMSALIAVLLPLRSVAYQNFYLGAVEAMRQAAQGRAPNLIVDLARAGPDRLTRYYMAGLEGAHVQYRWSRRDVVLERAQHLPAPAFAVLVSRQPIPELPAGYRGRVIFEGEEPSAPQFMYHVMVVQIVESPATGGGADG